MKQQDTPHINPKSLYIYSLRGTTLCAKGEENVDYPNGPRCPFTISVPP